MRKVGVKRGRIGGDSKVGAALIADFRYHDGDAWMDRSGYGQKMTNYGSVWNLNNRSFDGVDDNIGSIWTPPIMGLSELSVLARIKPDVLSGEQVVAIQNGPFKLSVLNNVIQFWIFNGSAWVYKIGSIALTAGQEYFILGRYNGSKIDVFVDGIKDGTGADQSGTLHGNGYLYIGAYSSGTAVPSERWFNGTIPYVAISSRNEYYPKILDSSIHRRPAA